MGQYDFETRYFTMNAESLPNTQELSSFDIDFGEKHSFIKMHISDFNKVTANNYWLPVDMMGAIEGERLLTESPMVNLPKLNQKEFGFSVSVKGNNSFDGTSSNYGVQNTVYKESRSVYFCAPSGYYSNRRARF
jgi:hypothetical protein